MTSKSKHANVANVCNFTLSYPSKPCCMKRNFLLTIFLAILLASCSSAYKSGQTPDDVYYSPTRETKKEETKKQNEKDEYASADDNYLHMKVRSYNRWNTIDDYSYWNDTRYNYQCNCNCYNYGYNPYIKTSYGWNNWYLQTNNSLYNPYYTLIPYKNPTIYTGNTTASNIKAYSNTKFSNTNNTYNPKTGTNNSVGNGFGNLVKKAFSSNNGAGSSWDRPARTFDNPSSSSPAPATSSSAGGNSGGYNSKGTSTGSGRSGRN